MDRTTGINHDNQALGLKGFIPPNVVALAAAAASATTFGGMKPLSPRAWLSWLMPVVRSTFVQTRSVAPAFSANWHLGRTREIQRRFNVSVPRARVPEKASTLRDRSER